MQAPDGTSREILKVFTTSATLDNDPIHHEAGVVIVIGESGSEFSGDWREEF